MQICINYETIQLNVNDKKNKKIEPLNLNTLFYQFNKQETNSYQETYSKLNRNF